MSAEDRLKDMYRRRRERRKRINDNRDGHDATMEFKLIKARKNQRRDDLAFKRLQQEQDKPNRKITEYFK